MPSKKKQTAFRLSEAVLNRLHQEAESQGRSANNLVEQLLDKHLPKVKEIKDT